MIKTTYTELLKLIKPYLAPKRSESASFLIWYLVNYYRLDEIEAIDSVCDQRGDKGVDGIYVNEGAGTIDIFQSKISQKENSTIGDTALKEFSGTLRQFKSKKNLEKLIKSAGDAEVVRLVSRLGLLDLLEDYELRGLFVANNNIDKNGKDFLKHESKILFVGADDLLSSYVSDHKNSIKIGGAKFDVSGLSIADYAVDQNAKAVIAPVKASELVKLDGIKDQSLFSLNVRASLGNTQVNRDIVASIKNDALHKKFLLFHNGITVLAEKVEVSNSAIKINNYFVVNGCQSLNALYRHKEILTDNLRLLVKFIQVKAHSELSEIITAYSNNQNGVKSRDFKSNHPIQTRLQNEFNIHYKGKYELEIKRGEPTNKSARVISNEDAGLQLIAFDLKEPWTTHRKYQVFEDKYSDIFGRPEVTADRIVLCLVLMDVIETKLDKLENKLIAKYVLTKYAILYTLRRIFESNDLGKKILQQPQKFVRTVKLRNKLRKVTRELLNELMIDLNLETKDLPDDFDYRGKMRDKDFISDLTGKLVASYQKEILRKKAKTMQQLWDAS